MTDLICSRCGGNCRTNPNGNSGTMAWYVDDEGKAVCMKCYTRPSDEECLALYDRMKRLAGERYKKERVALAQSCGAKDDMCPRCGAGLVLNHPDAGYSKCYCCHCAWSPEGGVIPV